ADNATRSVFPIPQRSAGRNLDGLGPTGLFQPVARYRGRDPTSPEYFDNQIRPRFFLVSTLPGSSLLDASVVNLARSIRRPRLNRDMTVPTGTFNTSAISRYFRPSMSESRTAIRNISGSSAKACLISSKVKSDDVFVCVGSVDSLT